jgi:hypothetical protein
MAVTRTSIRPSALVAGIASPGAAVAVDNDVSPCGSAGVIGHASPFVNYRP